MATTNHRKTDERYIAFIVVGALITMCLALMAGLLRMADMLEPQTGDIIAFPATLVPSRSTAAFIASVANSGTSCTLDVPTMQKWGGSLVVESTQFGPGRNFQVHWAGGRTSNGRDDCGRSADLLLNSNQLSALIFAAGGRGVKTQNQVQQPEFGINNIPTS